MKKIYFIVIAVVLVGIIVYSYYYPVVRNYPGQIIKYPYLEETYVKGDIIQPFKDFDFSSGRFTAYIIIKERIDLSDAIPHAGILKTDDINLLKGLRNVEFTYTESDMATVENEFLLYEGNELVFRSNIVVDQNLEGFQNNIFGWIEVTSHKRIADYIKDFHACFPIAVLPK